MSKDIESDFSIFSKENVTQWLAHAKIIEDKQGRFFRPDLMIFIRLLNQKTQNHSEICNQILMEIESVFVKRVPYYRVEFSGDLSKKYTQKLMLEAGLPRLGFLWLWGTYCNKIRKGERLELETMLSLGDDWGFFSDEAFWTYDQDARPRKNSLVFKSHPHFAQTRDILQPESDPYAPWLWLLNWHKETVKAKYPIDDMISFLKQLLDLSIFNKPTRILCCYILSELHLHPKKKGGPDLKTTQDYVRKMTQEHPLGLLDPKLPDAALKHGAWIRLQPFTSLLNSPEWTSEFLQAAPEILSAFHALLHLVPRTEEDETFCSSREYLKLLLQKFNPAFFANNAAEKLPYSGSFQGKICFEFLPRLIEPFLQADKLLKEQIESFAQKRLVHDSRTLKNIQETLEIHRQALAQLICEEIRALLSRRPDEVFRQNTGIWFKDQETRVRKALLQHVLDWPNQILALEENHLIQILPPIIEQQSPEYEKVKTILFIQESRQQITQLTRECLAEKLPSQQYTQRMQTVLRHVEQAGGKYHRPLALLGKVIANLMIVLSVGLLYPFFRSSIREKNVTASTGLWGCFYHLKTRRAAAIKCIAEQVSNVPKMISKVRN